MPAELHGKRLGAVDIHADTGCTAIAMMANGLAVTRIDGDTVLQPDADLVLIGDERAEERFLERYVANHRLGFRERLARLAGLRSRVRS